jgi:hypothetical protein
MSTFTRSSESNSKENLEARGRWRCPGNILGYPNERKNFVPYGYNLSLFGIASALHFLVPVALLVEALWRPSECLGAILYCAGTYISILVSFNQEITITPQNNGIRFTSTSQPLHPYQLTSSSIRQNEEVRGSIYLELIVSCGNMVSLVWKTRRLGDLKYKISTHRDILRCILLRVTTR